MPMKLSLTEPGWAAAGAAAGAVVAAGAMDALGVEQVELCPWALREGVILRRLDWLDGA
jgi:exopolyphosphatase/guanosine-5'-triphosphate,3'-diphosphate pyrophosphatase